MTEKYLILISGVQGAGKTTLAKLLTASTGDITSSVMFAADDYFYQPDGSYVFDPDKLGTAHRVCFENTERAMSEQVERVIVHNTFSREKEITPYAELAEWHKYKLISVVVENRHGNKDVHGVPQEVREAFAQRIKSRLKLL